MPYGFGMFKLLPKKPLQSQRMGGGRRHVSMTGCRVYVACFPLQYYVIFYPGTHTRFLIATCSPSDSGPADSAITHASLKIASAISCWVIFGRQCNYSIKATVVLNERWEQRSALGGSDGKKIKQLPHFIAYRYEDGSHQRAVAIADRT